MTAKEPVLLAVLIETGPLRWFVAGVGLDGAPIPLVRSEEGSLAAYVGVPFDEQVSFLRHRLSGVLQRGCDRLWGRQKKPCQIVFLADGPFPQAPPELAQQVAEHFVQWMTNPPVAFFLCQRGFAADAAPDLDRLAGDIEPANQAALEQGLPALFAALRQEELWELSQAKHLA